MIQNLSIGTSDASMEKTEMLNSISKNILSTTYSARVNPLLRRLGLKTIGHMTRNKTCILGTTFTLGKDVLCLLTKVFCCALPALILSKRITIKDDNESEIQDDWIDDGAFNEGCWWTGKTVFYCCPNRQAEVVYPEGYAMAGKKKTGIRNKTSAKQAARAQKFTNMSDLPAKKCECVRKPVNPVFTICAIFYLHA